MNKLGTLASNLTLVVLAVAGFVDALRDDRTRSAVLFAPLLVGVVVLSRTKSADTAVPLRRDLVSWLERTAPATGESPEDLANRAVSRLRAGFDDPQVNP
jgi:hypothetical protein